MRSLRTPIAAAVFIAAAVTTATPDATAISRDEVLARAKAYAFHPWTCASTNLTASCASAYESAYVPGDYMGLPYDWGGYMTLFDFDQQIADGYGAGSYPNDGVLSCTSGVDCSGFVSKAWDAGHYATATVHQTSDAIAQSAMLPGDIFNEAGFHMAMYSHVLASGEPVLYESVGYNVHLSMPGWSWVDGYTPRRYDDITGTTVGDPPGTTTNPIAVGSFPFSDQRDTTVAVSDVLDGCGAAPNTSESGPEYIYEVNVTSPGQLTVSVQDDAGVDIDVHLYTSMNTGDCVARNDASFTHPVDCGTYYVVADTFKGASEYPGPYTLTIDHSPSGGNCGAGPPSYDFEGQLGDPCSFPGNPSLPFCNPNLGADTCIYSGNSSFCSKPCAANSECTELVGGCCTEIGDGELYCMTSDFCGDDPPDSETEDPPDPEGDPTTSGAGGASAGAGGAPSSGAGNNSSSDPGFDDDDASTTSACTTISAPRSAPQGPVSWSLLSLLGLLVIRRRDAARG